MMVCEWLTSSVPTQLGAQGAHLRAFSLRKHRIIPRAGTESPPTDKCCVEGGRHLPKFTQQLSLPLTPTPPQVLYRPHPAGHRQGERWGLPSRSHSTRIVRGGERGRQRQWGVGWGMGEPCEQCRRGAEVPLQGAEWPAPRAAARLSSRPLIYMLPSWQRHRGHLPRL